MVLPLMPFRNAAIITERIAAVILTLYHIWQRGASKNSKIKACDRRQAMNCVLPLAGFSSLQIILFHVVRADYESGGS
jgi:hypothetical protein